MAINKDLELAVFARDKFTCCGCHKKFPHKYEIEPSQRSGKDVNYLLVDHIDGRDESIQNLQTLCWKCNSAKGGRAPHAFRLHAALKALGSCVVYYPALARLIGLKESIFLCQLIYWTPKGRSQKGDGWIYKSVEEMEEETGLSYKEQLRLRKSLIEQGLLEEQYERDSHNLFFRVNADALDSRGEHMTNGHMLKGNEAPYQREAGTLPKVSSYKEHKTTHKTTQEPKEPSASRSHNLTDTAFMTCEKRHPRIQGMIMRAYAEQAGIECPWDGAEGKQLQAFLKRSPRVTDQQIAQCIANMYSTVGFAKGTRPCQFLPYLEKYVHGPLNEFNREIGNGQISKSEQRSKRNDEKYARVLASVPPGNGRSLSLGTNRNGDSHLPICAERLPDARNHGNGKTIDAVPNRRLDGNPKAT